MIRSRSFSVGPTERCARAFRVSSYLSDPSDAYRHNSGSIRETRRTDTNHVSNATINGVSKQLTVLTQNSNYQKM